MATFGFVEYGDASPEVRGGRRRHHGYPPDGLDQQLLESACERPGYPPPHMGKRQADHGPGALAPLFKEMIYLAVSATNQCGYCIASHTAGRGGSRA